jgi:hypothetical protein
MLANLPDRPLYFSRSVTIACKIAEIIGVRPIAAATPAPNPIAFWRKITRGSNANFTFQIAIAKCKGVSQVCPATLILHTEIAQDLNSLN